MLELFIFAILLVVVAIVVARLRKIHKRKKDRAEQERKLQFALPDKNDEFVRVRLHSVLNEHARAIDTETRALSKEFSFVYIKKLLAVLKEAELSVADKIKMNDYLSLVGVYTVKPEWTGKDLQTVNELLSAVIKLSAKYAV